MNEPATIRCLAGGYPKPYVSWWRNKDLLPLQTERFEINRDYSLEFRDILLNDLGPYVCQAYSGQEKPVSKIVTLKAIGPVADPVREEDRPYLDYVIDPRELPTTQRPYRRPYQPRPYSPPPTPSRDNLPPILPPVVVDEPIGKY